MLTRGRSDGGVPRPRCWLGWAARAGGSREGHAGYDGGSLVGSWRRQEPKAAAGPDVGPAPFTLDVLVIVPGRAVRSPCD